MTDSCPRTIDFFLFRMRFYFRNQFSQMDWWCVSSNNHSYFLKHQTTIVKVCRFLSADAEARCRGRQRTLNVDGHQRTRSGKAVLLTGVREAQSDRKSNKKTVPHTARNQLHRHCIDSANGTGLKKWVCRKGLLLTVMWSMTITVGNNHRFANSRKRR